MRRRIKKWTRVKGHCKDECYSLPKPLRLINAREDMSKCILGPLFSQIEHVVCQLPWFIKYIPVKDRPRAIFDRLVRENANYVYTDYTSFEAHFLPYIMWAIEEPLYNFMCKDLPAVDFERFMSFWAEFVKGKNFINLADQFDCELDGTRMSGEMNTSLGNGWSNLVLFMFSLHEKGATWDQIFSDEVSGFVEGDDGLFRVPVEITPTTEQMASYGFCLKIGSTPDITEASFCGQVFDPENLVVMTDPALALMKLGWAGRKYLCSKSSTKDEILLSKALSTLYQYNGCPVIAPACQRIIAVLKGRGVLLTEKAKNAMGWYKGQILECAQTLDWDILPVARSTRFIIQRLYGIEIDTQMEIEGICSGWQYGDSVKLPFPAQYDMYADCYYEYVSNPRPVNQLARFEHYLELQKHFLTCGALRLPTYHKFNSKTFPA